MMDSDFRMIGFSLRMHIVAINSDTRATKFCGKPNARGMYHLESNMKPIRFVLEFFAEKNRHTQEVVNYRVCGETPDIARIDEPKERNFATIDGLLNATKDANLSSEIMLALRDALIKGQGFACEATEEQADNIRLGFRD